jgi:arsenate reductase (thioredoxin)
LILLFGPVSGAHFNPVVSVVDWALGRRTGTGMSGRDVLAYTGAQILGAVLGAVLANAMYAQAAFQVATHHRATGPTLLSEAVATTGLIALIFALARTGRAGMSAAAVGAYIGAAYWFTSSTSFANPAVTIGRMFSNTFAGIAPASVPAFVLAQLVGAGLGAGLVLALYPDVGASADDAVVPHGAKPSVLFVCVHNAGRSQMAVGWLSALAGDRIEVRSAGTAPAERINTVAVEAMAEVGIDITDQRPKILTVDAVEISDVVITMGCGDTCPILPGVSYRDWELSDPAGKGIDAVRPIRDEIKIRVQSLITELLAAPAKTA